MVVDTPTDDAMDAREHIDELGDVGDDDVRALLSSSLLWIERVSRSRLEELRDERCDARRRPATGSPVATHDDDVIGELSAEGWITEGASISPLPIDEHMALGILWERVEFRDADCADAYRALRAVAITRAWLGAHVDDSGVLDAFRVAVERVAGASEACATGDAIDVAIAEHFHLLDPRPWLASDWDDHHGPCSIVTLAGRHRGPGRSTLTPLSSMEGPTDSDVIGSLAERGETTSHDFQRATSTAIRPGEVAFDVEVRWGATFAWVSVVQRHGEWRVVEAAYAGQACIENYHRG
ncbi:MAG: hypothetical protein J0L92_13035 [Deltaproteobacteria bacterium]|nr:hypothetical protein [Deltaproteobacteria bacterium]